MALKQEVKIRHFDIEDRKAIYGKNPPAFGLEGTINTTFSDLKILLLMQGVPGGFCRNQQEYDQLVWIWRTCPLPSLICFDPLKGCPYLPCCSTLSILHHFHGKSSKETALPLIKVKPRMNLDEQECRNFCQDMKKASNVVYITDNCGEIVLDKIAIQILKKTFPNIRVTALVRGLPAGNDATMEDAEFCGLTDIVPVLGNGSDVGGTWFHGISTHARELLQGADVILAKGQGNYETMHGCGLNIYYLFLCKCDWFQQLFHAKLLQGMFINEKRAPKATAFSSD